MSIPSLEQARQTFYRNTGITTMKALRKAIIPVSSNYVYSSKHVFTGQTRDQNTNIATQEDHNNDNEKQARTQLLDQTARGLEAAEALLLLSQRVIIHDKVEEKVQEEVQKKVKEKVKENGKMTGKGKRRKVSTKKARGIEAAKKKKGKGKCEDPVVGAITRTRVRKTR